jgi:recombination protein RecR
MRKLINELTKLPSVGEKTAIRLAYHLVSNDQSNALDLAESLRQAHDKIGLCEVCYALADTPHCLICESASRARSSICVVEKPADLIAIENSGGYRGLYHVLHGLWSPLRGVGPEKTKIQALIDRVKKSQESKDPMFPAVQEVVLATGTTVEGDATAVYIASNLREYGVQLTRIAQGLPKGGELEYADEMTLTHALRGRSRID